MTVKSAPNIPQSRQANKAGVAEFFGVSVPAVDGWIRRGCPAVQRGQRGVPWVFDLLQVAEWRYVGPADEEQDEYTVPKDPGDRLDYYKAERERINLERELGELISVDEYRRRMSEMAKQMAATYDLLPDLLERDAGLEPEAIEVVERVIDGQRYDLYQRVIEDDAADG